MTNSHKNSKSRSHFTLRSVYGLKSHLGRPLLTPTAMGGSPAHIPLLCPSWQPEVPPDEVTRHWPEQPSLQVVAVAQPRWCQNRSPSGSPSAGNASKDGAHVTKRGHITQGWWASSEGHHWNRILELWDPSVHLWDSRCCISLDITEIHQPWEQGKPASQTRISPGPRDKVHTALHQNPKKSVSLPTPPPSSSRI